MPVPPGLEGDALAVPATLATGGGVTSALAEAGATTALGVALGAGTADGVTLARGGGAIALTTAVALTGGARRSVDAVTPALGVIAGEGLELARKPNIANATTSTAAIMPAPA